MLRTGITIGTALTVMCALAVTPVHAAELTTEGPGFKLATQLGATSASPARRYTITFASADMRRRYAPRLTTAVSQLSAAGLKISVGGVESVDPLKCPPKAHIQYTERYRPMKRGGYSRGITCPDPVSGMVKGGVVVMDSEYFDGSWYISGPKLHNTVVHEMLHTLGLGHPNLDLNGNGVVETYECAVTSHGGKPVMCSPSGGYETARAGRLTAFDIDGVKALLANARMQGLG